MEQTERFELSTHWVEASCSTKLSYACYIKRWEGGLEPLTTIYCKSICISTHTRQCFQLSPILHVIVDAPTHTLQSSSQRWCALGTRTPFPCGTQVNLPFVHIHRCTQCNELVHQHINWRSPWDSNSQNPDLQSVALTIQPSDH